MKAPPPPQKNPNRNKPFAEGFNDFSHAQPFWIMLLKLQWTIRELHNLRKKLTVSIKYFVKNPGHLNQDGVASCSGGH